MARDGDQRCRRPWRKHLIISTVYTGEEWARLAFPDLRVVPDKVATEMMDKNSASFELVVPGQKGWFDTWIERMLIWHQIMYPDEYGTPN